MEENQKEKLIDDEVREFDWEENLTDEEARELKQFHDILEQWNQILLQKCEEAWGDTLSLEQKNHLINSLFLKLGQELEESLSGIPRFHYLDLSMFRSLSDEPQISSEVSLDISEGEFPDINIEFSVQEKEIRIEFRGTSLSSKF